MINKKGRGVIGLTLAAIPIALIFVALNPALVVASPGGMTVDGTVDSCDLRIYGTFGEGPGDVEVTDPETGLRPENPPYTDPVGPFQPQHPQAPRKDFVTFNPAIMDHNQGYPKLDFVECGVHSVQRPQEKVFKRMWYEKEWFKDHDRDGCWDVVIDGYKDWTIDLERWNSIPEWRKADVRISEWNNDPTINDSNVDIYGPAINQEFTYMFLDDERMPIMIEAGSDVLIPMAHDPANPYRGLNSFDADGDGVRDAVRVESEATLGLDIDHDGKIEPMDSDGKELSGDETVVLVLGDKYMKQGDNIQFFDHVVTLTDVQELGAEGRAIFNVSDNEGGGSLRVTENVILQIGAVAYYYRAKPGSSAERETFYLRLLSADAASNAAVIEVGRMFGHTYANIGANPYWSQKAFIVDEGFYNVAAVKAQDNCIKYITFRQKLSKQPIKLYGKHLKVWKPRETLPEMPPFNIKHEVMVDVQDFWTLPSSQQDMIGPKEPRGALKITYVEESEEARFMGELKEIYNETGYKIPIPIGVVYGIDSVSCMHNSDPNNSRLEAAKYFTRKLSLDKDAAGVVCWSDKINYFWLLDNNFDNVNNAIDKCQNGGRHRDIDRALNKCINLLEDCTDEMGNDCSKRGATKTIIFMCGGEGIYTNFREHGPAYRANNHNIRIFTIGLNIKKGSQAEKDLKDMAENTGGVYNSHTYPYYPEFKEIMDEIVRLISGGESHRMDEFWMLEWFHTRPQQYTEFRLPAGDKYLVTLSWVADESEITIWDGDPDGPVAAYAGERFKFWYEDCSGPLYINASQSSIRLYGTFGEGPGDHKVRDPETGLRPENPPYSDPVGPFQPQNEQAPKKDFMTFNPAIMDHNQGYPQLDFVECGVHSVQRPQEKVFKRMWYEKEWFKDHDRDGCWDVVIDGYSDWTICLESWNLIPEWMKAGLRIREWNNDPTINDSNVDIYAPAINQEFTYMFLDDERMPITVGSGSDVLIPMAHDPANPYRGLNSFDADGDGVRDAVRVESEATLGLDIDHDGITEPMDSDGKELSGDETVVLVLGDKYMKQGGNIQFFDHEVTLKEVQELGAKGRAIFNVSDNEGGGSLRVTENVILRIGEVAYFYRAKHGSPAERETFYLRLLSADAASNAAVIEVGRMFGHTYANIGANPYWSQKAFIVDEVFYNVVAIKAQGNCIKYMVFREKLPKQPIKLYGKHLKVWKPRETLPEMPPFNMDHEIIVDVQNTWTLPRSQQEKIGPKARIRALNITYVEEGEEERFKGELKEIYNETYLEEFWNLEWFHTQPQQYTAFVMPEGQLYLMTLAWYAPESYITIWNHELSIPAAYYTGERVKFWYNPANNTDIYVNRV